MPQSVWRSGAVEIWGPAVDYTTNEYCVESAECGLLSVADFDSRFVGGRQIARTNRRDVLGAGEIHVVHCINRCVRRAYLCSANVESIVFLRRIQATRLASFCVLAARALTIIEPAVRAPAGSIQTRIVSVYAWSLSELPMSTSSSHEMQQVVAALDSSTDDRR